MLHRYRICEGAAKEIKVTRAVAKIVRLQMVIPPIRFIEPDDNGELCVEHSGFLYGHTRSNPDNGVHSRRT